MDAAEDGGVKAFLVVRVIFQRRNPRPMHACHPHAALGRHVRDGHVTDSESESEDESEEEDEDEGEELELELIQSHMAQKPVLRGEVGCACVAREVSVERGGMGERG